MFAWSAQINVDVAQSLFGGPEGSKRLRIKRIIIQSYLILDQELNTLDRSSSSFGDSSRDTAHYYRESVTEMREDIDPAIHPPNPSAAMETSIEWKT